MSRAIIISDCHLKPVMFDEAEAILASGQADFAVQMGDLVDDWGKGLNIGLYERTLKRAIKFHKDHPDTLWCVGNHDYGYSHSEYGPRESGYSRMAEPFVAPLLARLPQKIMHIVDDVIFTHAGLTKEWAKRQFDLTHVPERERGKSNLKIAVNFASPSELWQENSPIWARPQFDEYEMYPAKLQVVGHTPVGAPVEVNGVLSTDTWSTDHVGLPLGDRSFVIVDTVEGTWRYGKID